MKHFLKIVLIYLLLLALVLGAVDILYIRLEAPRNEIYKFRSMPERIDICNFGSSHGRKAYCYDDIAPDSSFNFGLTSQSLSYDYRLLQNYADRIEPGAVVFITVSYFSLYGVLDETERDDFLSKNRRYYKILDREYIKEYDAATDLYMNYFPAFIDACELWAVFSGTKHDDNQEWCHFATELDVAANAEIKYQNQIVTNNFDENGARVVNHTEVQALYDMIAFCREHGYHPYLITTPMTEEYLSLIRARDPAFLAGFQELVSSIAAETDTPYFNYGEDSRFTGDHTLFIDADHLNIDGAKRFTAILFDEVLHRTEEANA